MPTYEFRCPDGHEFEKFYRKISDYTSELPCPVCGKPATRLISGGAGLLFKGSGFYLTDYGKNAHRNAGPSSNNGDGKGTGDTKGAESTGTSSESKGSDTKSSESKPAETKATSESTSAKKPSSGNPKSGT
jgi:putative FmdB family regulatory protein